MWFDQANNLDLTHLSQYGVWGGVPIAPVKQPGLGRYGRFEFDRYLLLQKNDLTIAQRREVIFLGEHFHNIDHFEFFELTCEVNERQLKKAFFRFSKRFHPDVVRTLNLGPFSEHVQLVFEYGQQAYDLLMNDQAFRASYSRVTEARDQAYYDQLKAERDTQHTRLEAARAKGIKPPPKHQQRLNATPDTHTQRSQTDINQRKLMLRERLAKNQDRRQTYEQSKHSADLKSQTRTFFMAGEEAERRGQLSRALNHFKLCVEYMPKERKYIKALKRIDGLLNEEQAAKIWAESNSLFLNDDPLQQQVGLDLMREACELSPNERRLLVLTQKSIEFESVETIIPLLLSQHKVESMNLEYMWALSQCYESQKQLDNVKKYINIMLDYDPSEPRALRLKKRYRF